MRAILYQGKPLDLNNTLMNFQYLEKLVCQVLVLQSVYTLALAAIEEKSSTTNKRLHSKSFGSNNFGSC